MPLLTSPPHLIFKNVVELQIARLQVVGWEFDFLLVIIVAIRMLHVHVRAAVALAEQMPLSLLSLNEWVYVRYNSPISW